jgi:hypothetical protein
MVADPPRASHCAWSPLVFQYGERVCTCPPDRSQYCSISAVVSPAGDAADETDETDPDARAEGDALTETAGDEAAAEVAAGVVVVDADVSPVPQPASSNTDAVATSAVAIRLVLICSLLRRSPPSVRATIISRPSTDSDPR